jgi:catechol 2,3-dioxygenase-like lactoylglutathione lyase family enzyme
MKRFHVHVAVDDLEKSIGFYSALFGAQPTKQKQDYAKWMLDDPRVNFAISARGAKAGVDHFGLQVEAPEALDGLREQMKRADLHYPMKVLPPAVTLNRKNRGCKIQTA